MRKIKFSTTIPGCDRRHYLTEEDVLVVGLSYEEFGAPRGEQWPLLAVRRYLLYNTFLHEVGHLQLVNEKTKSERLRVAREKYAQEFANIWRRKLWSEHFDHPDPVHNAPAPV